MLIFFIVIVFVPFVLQIWLSKRESKYPGMAFPVLSFLFSAIVSINGIFVRRLILSMVLFNIPTVIHLVIYFSCREKFNRKKRMDRMNIQDL